MSVHQPQAMKLVERAAKKYPFIIKCIRRERTVWHNVYECPVCFRRVRRLRNPFKGKSPPTCNGVT